MLGFQTILLSCATAGAVITYGACRLSGRRGEQALLIEEICEERETLRRMMAALPEQLELAKRSRLADAKPTVPHASDATRHWLSELETDLAEARGLESQLPPAEVEGGDQSVMELDLRLAEILTLSIRANRLAEKYSISPPATGADPQSEQLDLRQPEMLPQPPHALEPSLSSISP
jgi:hypothetical protein